MRDDKTRVEKSSSPTVMDKVLHYYDCPATDPGDDCLTLGQTLALYGRRLLKAEDFRREWLGTR